MTTNATITIAPIRFVSVGFKRIKMLLGTFQARIAARRRLSSYQSLDARFARDIGTTPDALDWECQQLPWREIASQ